MEENLYKEPKTFATGLKGFTLSLPPTLATGYANYD
jgi:hypothetical protein